MQSRRLVSALFTSCQPNKGFNLLPVITTSLVSHHRSFADKLLPDVKHKYIYIHPAMSKRGKRKEIKKERKLLEEELEHEYGIPRKEEWNQGDWMRKFYSKELAAFQVRLGLPFTDDRILRSSFMHQSFIEELELTNEDYVTEDDVSTLQRYTLLHQCDRNVLQDSLSLVGYSMTMNCLKTRLYERYRNMTPNVCKAVCKFLMGRKTINELAKNLDLTEYILLSAELDNIKEIDKEQHIPFSMEDITSDTFFAFIGSIVVSCGEDVAQKFLKDFLFTLIDYTDLSEHVPMTLNVARDELQEILLLNGVTATAEERITFQGGVSSEFPLHFIGIFVNDIQIGVGASNQIEGKKEHRMGVYGDSIEGAKARAYQNAVFSCLEETIDFEQMRIEDFDTHVITKQI